MQLRRRAHVAARRPDHQADDATVHLTRRREADPDGRAARQLAHHRRQAARAASQAMNGARHRTSTYARRRPRRSQHAHLAGDAVIQLPGDGGKPGRQIMAAGPSTSRWRPTARPPRALIARENVQLDLPADGGRAARRTDPRRDAASRHGGEAGRGCTRATFTGSVRLPRDAGRDVESRRSTGPRRRPLDVRQAGHRRHRRRDVRAAACTSTDGDDRPPQAPPARLRRRQRSARAAAGAGREPGTRRRTSIDEQIAVDARTIDSRSTVRR